MKLERGMKLQTRGRPREGNYPAWAEVITHVRADSPSRHAGKWRITVEENFSGYYTQEEAEAEFEPRRPSEMKPIVKVNDWGEYYTLDGRELSHGEQLMIKTPVGETLVEICVEGSSFALGPVCGSNKAIYYEDWTADEMPARVYLVAGQIAKRA